MKGCVVDWGRRMKLVTLVEFSQVYEVVCMHGKVYICVSRVTHPAWSPCNRQSSIRRDQMSPCLLSNS